jgi:glycosyltransferase involved in cell wall biosynthesis
MVANSAVKDHATIIHALPQIRRAHPQARLILVGKDLGTLADNRQLAQQLGVGAAVRFITDTCLPDSFIAASRVCVLTSGHESFSNAILEYMALAKPVVVTETCGDSAALIRDGESGFVVPLGAPEPLAARIIELLSEPQRARRMGEMARRRVEKFSVARMVAESEALFESLLMSSPPALEPTAGHR